MAKELEEAVLLEISCVLDFVKRAYQINATGIKDKIREVLFPDGEDGKLPDYAETQAYQDLKEFYDEIDKELNKRGSIMILERILSENC